MCFGCPSWPSPGGADAFVTETPVVEAQPSLIVGPLLLFAGVGAYIFFGASGVGPDNNHLGWKGLFVHEGMSLHYAGFALIFILRREQNAEENAHVCHRRSSQSHRFCTNSWKLGRDMGRFSVAPCRKSGAGGTDEFNVSKCCPYQHRWECCSCSIDQ